MNSEYDYLANSAFYTTVANTLASTNGIVDMNNNRATMARYYGVGANCGGKQSGNNHQSGHIYTNKVLPSTMMTKYTNAGNYMHGGGSVINATHPNSMHDSNASNYHTAVTQGHYTNHANSTSYGYQRNRYMPYNRSTTLHQNPLQSTAAITTCGGLTSSTVLSNGYNQFTSPIYQTCAPGMMQQTLTSTTPLTAVSVQQTQLHHPHSLASTMTSTTHCSPSCQEFTYAHAVASSLAPSTTTTTVVPTTDNKNPISLATVVTTSCGSSTCSTDGSTVITSTPYSATQTYATVSDPNDTVTLQITNLDYSMDEASLRNFLLNQLKPITPVVSLTFEGSSYAKVTVPDLYVSLPMQYVSGLY